MITNKIERFFGDYAFLSNFWLAPVRVPWDDFIYPATEHAYQAAKTSDVKLRRKMLSMTPGQSKRAGRKNPLRPDWEQVKVNIMTIVVSCKFAQHKDLAQKLIDTGSKYIIEGNYHGDRYWGVDENGIGQNVLGNILMQIRDDLVSDSPFIISEYSLQ